MINFFKAVWSRIDIIPIIANHYAVLYDYNLLYNQNKKVVPFSDQVLFFYFPTFLSILLLLLNFKFDKDAINLLVTALSIFTGLLLSLLVLIFDLGRNENEALKKLEPAELIKIDWLKRKIQLVKELFSNVLFSVLLSSFCILFSLLTQLNRIDILYHRLLPSIYEVLKTGYLAITNFIAIFALIQFFLALLMILKRFKILFDIEFRG